MTVDFKIVGSGPTGSYCAARLAQLGYKVTLVDKAHFPRDKLCGGGLTLKSLSRLRQFFTGFDNSGVVDYVKSFEIMNPSTHKVIPFFWITNWLGLVKRDVFDDWIRNKAIEAGVEYREEKPESVVSLVSGGDNSYKYLIGADGANSGIGQYIHGRIPNNEVVIATEAYTPNKTGQEFASIVLNPTHDPDNAGYSWLFGRADRIGIGTGVMRNYDKWMNSYRNLITSVAASCYNYTVEPKDYKNWIIPIYKKGRKANEGKHIACIGDALGVADPIYAEGIAAGMISADVLVASFEEYHSFEHFTEDLHNHEYFQQMRWMELLQRQANGDYQLAFHALEQPNVILGFIKFINWRQTPKQFVNWMIEHHPILISRLQIHAMMNKGKEL